jgi:G-protein alpha subunit
VDLIEVPNCKLRRIIHQFDEVDACLLTLDLASYDHYLEEGKGHNTLETSLRPFKGICRMFKNKAIFLVCLNFKLFSKKLAKTPLSVHFEAYTGGADPGSAADYILERCRRLAMKDQEFFFHVADDDAEDTTTVDFFKTKTAGLLGTAYMLRALGLQNTTPYTRRCDKYRRIFPRV